MDEGTKIVSTAVKRGITEVLLQKGIITDQLLAHARKIQSGGDDDVHRSITEILVEECGADRDSVYQEVARYYAFKIIDMAQESLDADRFSFVQKTFYGLPATAQDLALRYKVLPYKLDSEQNDKLLIVTTDPTKREIYLIARFFPFRKFEICYISSTQWEDLWKEVRSGQKEYSTSDLSHDQFMLTKGEEEIIDETSLDEEINRSRLTHLIENMLGDAARADASDVHVVPRGPRTTQFHFRMDGKLTLWHTLEDVRAEAVAAVVKDRARNLDRFERNAAQDGFAQMVVDGKTIRYRFSVIPVVGKEFRTKYESIVIRVLQEPRSTNLAELGFDPYADMVFRNAIRKPYGIIIVTGPTGSGKSTTLNAALRMVMNPQLNVVTVEDPVEYFVEGARQVKLNPKLDFEGALRAILRHDPDIVMVGEMRDRVTAEIAIKVANTGHLAFSTLHTNDAPSAVARLYKMGVEPFLIAYAINIVLSQRLLRKLCPRCKSPIQDVDAEALRKINFPMKEIEQTIFYRPVGCNQCIRGYKGRIAIHEALYFSKEIRHLIFQAREFIDEELIRQQALKEGMQTLRMSAVRLLRMGVTTPEEVVGTTTED